MTLTDDELKIKYKRLLLRHAKHLFFNAFCRSASAEVSEIFKHEALQAMELARHYYGASTDEVGRVMTLVQERVIRSRHVRGRNVHRMPRDENQMCERMYFAGLTETLSTRDFKRIWRLDKPVIMMILENMRLHDVMTAGIATGVSLEVKLKACMLVLAGMTFKYAAVHSQMSEGNLERFFYQFLDVVRHEFNVNGEVVDHDLFLDPLLPGCLGYVDCTTIEWESCPVSLHGAFKNPKDSKKPVVKFQAIVDKNYEIIAWDGPFPGSQDDISVMARTWPCHPAMQRNVQYEIASEIFHRPYLVADGGYKWIPELVIAFNRSELAGATVKQQVFNATIKSKRKVVECAFGILKAKFPILKHLRIKTQKNIQQIAEACVALYNYSVRYRLGAGQPVDDRPDFDDNETAEAVSTVDDDDSGPEWPSNPQLHRVSEFHRLRNSLVTNIYNNTRHENTDQ